MPFVYVERADPKCLKYLKAEDPQYAQDNQLQIDALHYYENVLMNPVALLFDPILGSDDVRYQHLSEDVRDRKRTAGVIARLTSTAPVQAALAAKGKAAESQKRDFENKKRKQHAITTFFKR